MPDVLKDLVVDAAGGGGVSRFQRFRCGIESLFQTVISATAAQLDEPVDELLDLQFRLGTGETIDRTALEEGINRRDRLNTELAGDLGFLSMSILTIRTAPLAARTVFSSSGPSCLHGSHQGAQKSTMTGTVREVSITSAMKVRSLLSLIRSAAG